MASRPVFISSSDPRQLVEEVSVSFPWAGGFAASQKKKNVLAMHEAALTKGIRPILEVSTKSEEKLGQRLSAFNLKIGTPVGDISIECAFQGSKIFEHGGPFTDLYTVDSRSAKRDERLKSSGRLIGFDFFGEAWPLEPKTCFYDWLYLSALKPHKNFLTRLFEYSGFSDIEFNPEKSINCQARTCALLVSLLKRDMFEDALRSKDDFISIARGTQVFPTSSGEPFQPGLLDKQATESTQAPIAAQAVLEEEPQITETATSFEEAGFLSHQAQNLIPSIKDTHKSNFELAYNVNKLLQNMMMDYSGSPLHTTSLSKENIYTASLIRSASLFQGLLILIERGMTTEGQIFLRCLIENAFFVAALEQSHDDVVRYLKESDKFSRYKMAEMLISHGAINSNHPDFVKISQISQTKTKPPQTIKTISRLGELEQKYLKYSYLSSESMHFSASSISKYMSTSSDRKDWLGYKLGPAEDEDIAETIKEGISAVLDIAVVGTTIFGDSNNNQKIRRLAKDHYADAHP